MSRFRMLGIPKKITSHAALEKLGRVRLSDNFFMRDFLYSDIADFYGLPNYPDFPEVAVEAGTQFCQLLLEPLKKKFGHITIRSAYRSPTVNDYGNKNKLGCSKNETNYAAHIWDYKDGLGGIGALSTIQIPWFADRFEQGKSWQSLAWWIHDHLPYSSQYFYPKRAAVNLGWRENPLHWIKSHAAPKGKLTEKGMSNWNGDHSAHYNWINDELG